LLRHCEALERQGDCRDPSRHPLNAGGERSSGQDLYYRLKSHHINIPPLRDRQSDIPYLVATILPTQAAEELGKKRPALPKELFTLLKNYPFPGNVRELRGMIFDAVSLHSTGILSLDSVRKQIAGNSDG